ncbi:MAG: aminotransferase class III-fold pyridoxal phosphate-dependent enzyme [Candidatus Margulisiibacteriota bacterium]|jgi:4-aminobutyrate aminotransferase-like enzyme
MMKNLVERAKKVMSPALGHYTELPVTHGKGVYLFDEQGNKYLDLAAGIAVALTGHSHPKVVKAISQQAKKLIHACAGIVYYEANVELAEKLAQITCFPQAKTFFSNSGSEAIEGAVKLARYVTHKPGLVAFAGGFHGRTFGALSLTSSKAKYLEGYAPLLPDVTILPKELDALKSIDPSRTAALLIEPVQGEGGYLPCSKEFLQGLRNFCSANNIMLIFDEVQCGLGRTGKWFAYEHYDLKPDILVLAKGIASGMPLGAIIADASIMDQWKPSAHGGTFTGNPVCCAAGLATLAVVEEEKLLENTTEVGRYLLESFTKSMKKCRILKDVRGLGLMIGLELESNEQVKKVLELCLQQKVILISCGLHDQVVRLAPPLILKMKDAKKAFKIIRQGLLDAQRSS